MFYGNGFWSTFRDNDDVVMEKMKGKFMQIVIDIDENLYTRLFDNGDEYVADMRRACVAIRKGIPLPKGHGRLKDVDHYIKMQWEHPDYSLTDDEPTIIEKDGD